MWVFWTCTRTTGKTIDNFSRSVFEELAVEGRLLHLRGSRMKMKPSTLVATGRKFYACMDLARTAKGTNTIGRPVTPTGASTSFSGNLILNPVLPLFPNIFEDEEANAEDSNKVVHCISDVSETASIVATAPSSEYDMDNSLQSPFLPMGNDEHSTEKLACEATADDFLKLIDTLDT